LQVFKALKKRLNYLEHPWQLGGWLQGWLQGWQQGWQLGIG